LEYYTEIKNNGGKDPTEMNLSSWRIMVCISLEYAYPVLSYPINFDFDIENGSKRNN